MADILAEERAEAIFEKFKHAGPWGASPMIGECCLEKDILSRRIWLNWISAAITEAVKAERAAIASELRVLAEATGDKVFEDTAKLIEARGQVEPADQEGR